MLDPLPITASLRWLWPEMVLLGGGVLSLLLHYSRDVSWLTAPRLAPITALIALAASYAVPFETVALAGDLFRSDVASILAIRIILSATLASLLLGGRGEILLLALAGCLAARASDSLTALMAIQFMGIAVVFLAVRSGAAVKSASRFLAISTTSVAVAAIGLSVLIGATAATSFVPIGISLAHRSTVEALLATAAMLPVTIIALFAAGTPDAEALLRPDPHTTRPGSPRVALPSVTRAAVATIIPAGLLLLLLRLTGSGLAGDVGSATGAAIKTIPWRTIVGLIALGTMFRGTMRALTSNHSAAIVSGLLLAQAGWLLAGAAQGTIPGARAVLVALLTGFPAAFVLRPAPDSGPISDKGQGLSNLTARLAGLVALLSLAGSPGTLGFIGRWDLFDSARIGPVWWLAACGSILWVLSILAAIRWYLSPASNAAATEVGWPGRVLAVALLAFSLAGSALHSPLLDSFPFP